MKKQMNDNLTISRENALAAYDNTDANGRELLEHLFGKELFVKKDITERVKTFEDAMETLGRGNTLVEEYIAVRDKFRTDAGDLITYLKLRIITAALNEGWEPQFTEGECRYYPWFKSFTQREFNKVSDDEKGYVARSGNSSSAYFGFVFVNAYCASSISYSSVGARLAFKTRELAEYAGRQFVELYVDFVFLNSKNK